MPPALATLIFTLGIVALFKLDRDDDAEVSPALWIPTIWILISGSRMVSTWLDAGGEMKSPDAYLDGSPLDRFVLTVLLAAGLLVLLWRSRRTAGFLSANGALVAFFLYCGLSVLWSEYPAVAFKRWTKIGGDFAMVLVVLTDPAPRAAVRRLVGRAVFLLVPISVLLIKYYPDLGRGYDRWTWSTYYAGVAGGKNGLGYVCLVVGLGSLWRWLAALRPEDGPLLRRPLIAHSIVLMAVLWLFWKADSATSLACFIAGASVLTVTTICGSARSVSPARALAGALVVLVFAAIFVGSGTGLVEAMGRDSTLTGRTDLWNRLLGMTVDPFFGTGFESFWLGERVEKFWSTYWWHPNQAHNGYLEIFLNLGWIGIALLAVVIVAALVNIRRTFGRDNESARLRLAFLVVAIIYNFTEAAFKSFHLVFIAFLLAAVARPVVWDREES